MKSRTIIIILILVILIPTIYILLGISKNVHEMQAAYTTTFYYPAYPTPNTQGKTSEQIAIIKRGEYLVKAGDCIACHTNTTEKGPAFAGGLAMQTPFGTIYTPNITPDKETGLGAWTDDNFIKAMHDGISPSGSPYYPAFPYLYFNQVTYDDLKAIKAYLDSIPAVHQENHKNGMMWPFNWRFLQYGWRLLFFHSVNGPYQTDSKQSDQWNRGAYLVEGLGHCGMCHTPSYYLLNENLPLAAPIQKFNLTGSVVQGYLAPNITQTNLAAISNQELMDIFTKARLIGGGDIQGPMLEAVHDSLSNLTPSDLIAIAAYLKTVKSKMPAESPLGTSDVGSVIYNNYCSGCHASGVHGAPKFGDTASWTPLIRSGMDKLYRVAINGVGYMPPRGMCTNCMNSDIKKAVDYMAAAALNAPSQPVVVSAKKTPRNGEQIYQENCSSCHSTGKNNAPKIGDQQAWKPIVNQGFFNAYRNVVGGLNGHPLRGNCKQCNDQDILAAVKYIMQKSAPGNNFILW